MAKVKQEYILEVTSKGLKEIVREIKALRSDLTSVTKETAQGFARSGKAAGEAADGYSRAGKSAGEYDRNAKGAAKATNNSTKAFSKMAQGMGGTLVPAYATVAANVFALTAAFGALERAADTQILIKASEELAAQTGRSLVSLSKNMQDITGNAISMKEALTSASIAASAGFDNSTIEQLTEVARNASIALGRDMTDSLNRVFKGAIKAEPELLDELGIILRLDPATREYAASIGKAVSELTTFEKQQAVVNAVLEQGQEKFGKLSEVDPNPYTQLAASFSNVANSLLTLLNVGIAPIIGFFSTNELALTGALLIFASSVIQRAIPAITQLETSIGNLVTQSFTGLNFADALKNAENAVEGTFSGLKRTGGDSVLDEFILNDIEDLENIAGPAIEEFATKLGNAFLDAEDMTTSYTNTLISVTDLLTELEQDPEKFARVTGEELEKLVSIQKFSIAALEELGFKFLELDNKGTRAFNNLTTRIKTFNSVVKGGIRVGFLAGLSQGFTGVDNAVLKATASFKLMEQQNRAVNSSLQTLSITLIKVSGVLGTVVKKFFSMIPIVGQLMFAWQLLSGAVTWVLDLFRDSKAIQNTNKALENQTEAIDTATESANRYIKDLKNAPKSITNVNKSLELQNNILMELNKTNEEIMNNSEGFGFFGADIDDLTDNLNNQLDILKKIGEEDSVVKLLKQFGEQEKISSDNAIEFQKTLSKVVEELAKTKAAAKDMNTYLDESFKKLDSGFKKIQGALPSLTGAQEVFVTLGEALGALETQNSLAQITAIQKELGTYGANLLGISKELEDSVKQADFIEPFTEKNKELQDEISATEELIERFSDGWKKLFLLGYSIKKGKSPEEQLRALKEEQKTYSDVIDNSSLKQQRNLDIIISKLEEFRNKLKESVYSANELAKASQRINFELSIPGKSIKDQIALTKELSNEQIKAIQIQQAAAKVAITAVNQANNNAKETILNYKRQQEGYQGIKVSLEEYKRALIDQAALETQNIQLLTLAGDLGVKTNEIRIKQVEDYIKKLKELSLIEINTLIDFGSSEVLTEIEPLLNTLGISLRQAGESAEEFKNRILEALTSYKEFSKLDINVNSGAANKALADRLLGIQLESQYLRDNNSLMGDRIDKEYLLAEAEAKRELDRLNAAFINPEITSESELEAIQTEIANIEAKLGLIRATGAEIITQQLEQETKKAEVAIAGKEKELKLGLRSTVAGRERVKIAELEAELIARAGGLYAKGAQERLDAAKKLSREEIKLDIQSQLNSSISAATTFSDIMKELRENLEQLEVATPFEKFQAGLLAINKIAEQSGNKTAISLSQLSTLVSDFGEKGGFAAASLGENLEFASSMLGAVGGAFEEGSKAAETFKLAQMALATVSAVNAVLEQGKGDPYTAFARMAAMASSVAALLSQADIAFSAGGSASGSDAKAQKIKEDVAADINEYGVRGRGFMESNALVDSIDQLKEINYDLFSAEYELVRSINKLDSTFQNIGSVFTRSFGSNFSGSFTAGALASQFGRSYTTTQKSSAFGFKSSSKTLELLDAGIQLSLAIEEVNGLLVGVVEDGVFYLQELYTKVKGSWLGKDTKVSQLFNTFELSTEQIGILDKALKGTLDVFNNMSTVLTNILGLDVAKIFSGYQFLFDDEKISLLGKAGEEVGDVVAALFSAISSDVINDLFPWINNFVKTGEELLDTMIRLVKELTDIDYAFKSVGSSLTDFVGLSAADPSQQLKNTWSDYYDKALSAEEQSRIDFLQSKIDALNEDIVGDWKWKYVPRFTDFMEGWEEFENTWNLIVKSGKRFSEGEQALSIENMQKEIERITNEAYANITGSAEEFAANAIIEWTNALTEPFEDTEEWSAAFEAFRQAIFTEGEILQQDMNSASNSITSGLEQASTRIEELGLDFDLDRLTSEGLTTEGLKQIFLDLQSIDAFAARINPETGETITAGADLLNILIALGLSFEKLDNAAEKVTKFNDDLIKQIDLFGRTGKDLDLTQLKYEYEDALNEAIEIGGDIALVEQLYGLKRLDIIRQYNQEILDNLETTYNSINEAMISVVNTSESWSDVAYYTLKTDKMVTRLKTSLGSLADSIDFSAFDSSIDTSNFEELFGFVLNFEDEIPTDINAQIDLVEQLKTTVMDRYAAEEQAILDIGDLLVEIGDYIDDLKLGDLSPLTNVEKLTEAQSQFNKNLALINSEDAEVSKQARDNLLTSADAYLSTAQEYYGISMGYQDIFKDVTDILYSLQQDLSGELALSKDTLAITALQEETLTQLGVLNDILDTLNAQNTIDFQTEIDSIAASITGDSTLADIVAKLESLESGVWSDIVSLLGGVPEYNIGSPEIEFDQIAKVHKGEMILTPKTAEDLRNGDTYITNTSSIVDRETNTNNNDDIIAAIQVLTQVLAASQEDLLDQGEKLIVQNSQRQSISPPTAKLSGII